MTLWKQQTTVITGKTEWQHSLWSICNIPKPWLLFPLAFPRLWMPELKTDTLVDTPSNKTKRLFIHSCMLWQQGGILMIIINYIVWKATMIWGKGRLQTCNRWMLSFAWLFMYINYITIQLKHENPVFWPVFPGTNTAWNFHDISQVRSQNKFNQGVAKKYVRRPFYPFLHGHLRRNSIILGKVDEVSVEWN